MKPDATVQYRYWNKICHSNDSQNFFVRMWFREIILIIVVAIVAFKINIKHNCFEEPSHVSFSPIVLPNAGYLGNSK